jgi:DNA-binding response OmpR family regulator
MDEVVALARAHGAAIGFRGEVFAAQEGMRIELPPRPVASWPGSSGRPAVLPPAVVPEPGSVVVVAPTPEIASVLHDAAAAEGFAVELVSDLRVGFERVVSERPSSVLVEAVEDDGGFDLVAAIRSLGTPYGQEVPVILVGPASARRRPDAIETGITEWLVWPCSAHVIRTKLRAWRLRRPARWLVAPPVADEAQRLASLDALGVLDTGPEERFDRYTREIAEALDVPVALVSLVDRHRQWFKSRYGTDLVETSRDLSLCAHAIHGADVFQVPDALADERFADNPMVRESPRVRFYAGMPLRLSDGVAVGTLCVIDTRPRRLDEHQLAELRRVAALVVAELEPDARRPGIEARS